jgi:rubrerythrin
MLELDIKMEEEDVESYMKHAAMEEELGLIELQTKLEEIAADERGHARALTRLGRGL